MNTNDMESQSRKVAEVLNRAVADTLDRKRRLGQYAVMWRDGRTVRVEAADLPTLPNDSVAQARASAAD